ncbi:hypothetical protein E8E13_010083 [Curvularia kusanoi]|uniref:Uncharacterized protein n=1 Tax=Curvularia kusanoi TaxID=90978 RepID=A0A9P4TG56_CURKU|nr:hypothetical protein E8E13_010083 [Curvularia kusanoi]
MWRRHLVPGLLWWADGEKVDGSPSSRPSKYRAPTWSWASIDGIVYMEDNLVSEWRIQVVDYKLEYATHDITGIITGGWIDLRGHLKPFSLRWNVKGYLRCFKWQMALDGETVWSQDESIAEEDWSTKLVDLDVPTSNSEAFDEDNAQQRLYCLVSRAAKDAKDYVPILLLRLLDAERNLFERIGLASCPPGQGLAMLEAELHEDVKSSLPCSRYEDGLHTIRIV